MYIYTMNKNEYDEKKRMIFNEYFKITNDEQYSAILTKIHFSKYTNYPSIQKIKAYFNRKVKTKGF